MRITPDMKLGFDDVLIRPKRSSLPSRSHADLTRVLLCPHSENTYISGVPIIAANMDTVATIEMAAALRRHGMFTAVHKFVDPIEFNLFTDTFPGRAFFTIGPREGDLEALDRLSYPDLLCLDTPNGYTEPFVDLVKRVRERFPEAFILAGNVATPEMTEALILAGASCVKVGIGGGSACTTRLMTGVGYPQLSAVVECSDAAHGLRGHVASDGGCRTPGDVAKAFCAGADMVMLGGMLSGTTECGGDVITDDDGKSWMEFRGMSSSGAMEDHYGGVSEYRASEGKTTLVPFKGPVGPVVQQILGGLRSCCSLIGARNIKDMPKCATLVLTREQENQVFGREFKWWER